MKYIFPILLTLQLISCKEKTNTAYQTASELRSIPLANEYLNRCYTKECLAEGHYLLAWIYNQKYRFDSAHFHIMKAINICNQKNKPLTNPYRLSGDILSSKGHFSFALKQYEKALSLNKNEKKKMYIKNSMSPCFWEKSQFETAIKYSLDVLDYFKKEDNHSMIASANFYIGLSLMHIEPLLTHKNYYSSLDHLINAYECYNTDYGRSTALSTIGNLNLKLGRLDLAELYLDSALKITPDKTGKQYVYYHLGCLFQQKKEFKKSLHYFGRLTSLKKDSSLALDLLPEISGAYTESLKIHFYLDDTSSVEQKTQALDSIMDEYMLESNSMANQAKLDPIQLPISEKRLKAIRDNEPITWDIYTTIAISIIFITILLALIWIRRQKQKKAEKLSSVKGLVDIMNTISN